MEEHAKILIGSIFSVQDTSASVRGGVRGAREDDPFALIQAKSKFAEKAVEVDGRLRDHKTAENNEITNKILIELYAIGLMLNNATTIGVKSIKSYTQRLSDLSAGDLKYDELHSMAVEMETDCAKAMNGAEVLANIKIRMDIAQSQYDAAKAALQYATDLKFAGLWALVAGTLGGLFVMGLSALTGNVVGLQAGLAEFVGSLALGGGIAIAGMFSEAEAKQILDKRGKELKAIQAEYADKEAAIQKGVLAVIKKCEDEAKKILGISD